MSEHTGVLARIDRALRDRLIHWLDGHQWMTVDHTVDDGATVFHERCAFGFCDATATRRCEFDPMTRSMVVRRVTHAVTADFTDRVLARFEHVEGDDDG